MCAFWEENHPGSSFVRVRCTCRKRRGQDSEHWRVSLRLADGSGVGEADDARKAWKNGRGGCKGTRKNIEVE